MPWHTTKLWQAVLAFTVLLFPLLLLMWIPVSVAGAHEKVPGLAASATVTVPQATPTTDATVTALNKEKLTQEVDRTFGAWLWSNAAAISSAVVLVIGALVGYRQWRVGLTVAQGKELEDRKAEREKQAEEQKRALEDRAEERFQAAVMGLGDEKEGAKIGAAILLRTFLRPGYEQFYTQTFDLAVANLRLPRTAKQPEDPDGLSHSPEDATAPLALTTLSQALIVVFKEAFPLARDQKSNSPQSLDATDIQLDNAYLSKADLNQVWMPRASLRKADLSGVQFIGADLKRAHLNGAMIIRANLSRADLRWTDLSGAYLNETDLSGAYLTQANLSGTYLSGAQFIGADLRGADLSGADLSGADLNGAYLSGTNLSGAQFNGTYLNGAYLSGVDLSGTNLSGAHLNWANLSGVDLSGVDLRWVDLSGVDLSWVDLSGTNLSGVDLSGVDLSTTHVENAANLERTNLHNVKGLTTEQLQACKAKGALIDEDAVAGTPQPTAPATPSSQSSDSPPLPSTLPTQGTPPTPDAGGSSSTAPSE